MQVVTVGMSLTGKHLTHIETFQAAFDTLYFFQCVNFKTCRCQRIAHLLGSEVEINVFLQPFVGNIHYTDSLVITNCEISACKGTKKSVYEQIFPKISIRCTS